MIIRNTALGQFVRYGTCCLLLNLVLAVALQPAAAAGPLTVDEFAGPVKVKLEDRWRDPQVGMHVTLPAAVSTGNGGSMKLAQDGSFISVGENTALEFLAGPEPGQLVKRVVQNKGSAFYDISNREHRKLRVETPYLVAVIKGTQFNVTVDPSSASVSLFEGLLQVEAPDIGEVVELQAGFIARRQAGDTSITIIRMDNGEAASGKRSGVGASGSGRPGDGAGAGGETRAEVDDGDASTGDPDDGVPGAIRDDGLTDTTLDPQDTDADDVLQVDLDLDGPGTDLGDTRDLQPGTDPLILEASGSGDIGTGEVDVDLGADASVGDIDAGLDAGLDADLGSGEIGVDLGADASVGDIDAGLDAGVDADLGSGDLSADLGADVDAGDIDAGLDAGVDADLGSGDLSADLGADVDAGDIDAGLDAGVDADLGSGDLSADLGADADAGDIDAGLDAGVDADLGSGDLSADLGADVDAGDIDAGLDAGVDADLGSGDLSADLGVDADIGDTGVDAGVEADLGSGDLGVDASVGDVGVDVGVDDGSLDVDADLGVLDDTVDLVDDLLGGDDTATDDTEEEEDEALLPDLGNLLGL